MPDCSDSTHSARQALQAIARDLQQLDERLRSLAESIAPDPSAVLPSDLRAGVESVREVLLRDAISTLTALADLNEDAALERRAEILANANLIAAFG